MEKCYLTSLLSLKCGTMEQWSLASLSSYSFTGWFSLLLYRRVCSNQPIIFLWRSFRECTFGNIRPRLCVLGRMLLVYQSCGCLSCMRILDQINRQPNPLVRVRRVSTVPQNLLSEHHHTHANSQGKIPSIKPIREYS